MLEADSELRVGAVTCGHAVLVQGEGEYCFSFRRLVPLSFSVFVFLGFWSLTVVLRLATLLLNLDSALCPLVEKDLHCMAATTAAEY